MFARRCWLTTARRALCSSSKPEGSVQFKMASEMAGKPGSQAAPVDGALGAVTSADEIPTLKLYRDCLKLTYHIAAQSAKGDAMRSMIRQNFRTNVGVTDPKEISRLKMLAIVGLQNYVIHEQTGKAIEKRKRGT